MKHLCTVLTLTVLCGCFWPNPEDNEEETPEAPLRRLWEYAYEIEGWGTRAQPVLVGDSLILMTGDKYLTCIRIDSGMVKWRFPIPGGNESLMRTILFDENQVYSWQEHQAFAVNIFTGTEKWAVDSVADYGRNGLSSEYYYSAYGKSFFQLALCGDVNNSVISDHAILTISCQGNRVYCGQGRAEGPDFVGRIICYAENTLDSLWTYANDGGSFGMCYPKFEDEVLYTGTVWGNNCQVIALNAETGEVIWETSTYKVTQVEIVGDTLICDHAGSVSAIDKYTGEIIWHTLLPVARDLSSMAIWDGYIYNTVAGGLYIFDIDTGEIVERMLGPDEAYIEQVAAGAGMIFVQSTMHLYAFEPYNPGED